MTNIYSNIHHSIREKKLVVAIYLLIASIFQWTGLLYFHAKPLYKYIA